jgi:CubicO group peptidase (beta-lactamase class C family)
MTRSAVIGLVCAAVIAGCGVRQDGPPTTAPSAQSPDQETLARLRAGSMLTWRGEDQRIGYANMDRLAPTNRVRRGARASQLTEAPMDFTAFRYSFGGASHGLDHFMSTLNVVGIIVITDGRIVLERYARGHTADARWESWSVAKSVTSLLFGAAVRDGHIATLDDEVKKYIPSFAGTSYEGVTLRHLLQMSSGVAWNGDMSDPQSDVAQLPRLNREGGLAAQIAFLGTKPRKAPPGTAFNYNTAEADVTAAVLQAATGLTLSEYLSEKIWQPFGMQADAHWITIGTSGLERAGCCLSATLRDYGRLGLVALNDGVAPDGRRVLPAGWMAESTRPSAASKAYGYFWWLRRNEGLFASGSFGQHIEIAPGRRTVVAVQSYWPEAYNDELIAHNDTVVAALIAYSGRSPGIRRDR